MTVLQHVNVCRALEGQPLIQRLPEKITGEMLNATDWNEVVYVLNGIFDMEYHAPKAD